MNIVNWIVEKEGGKLQAEDFNLNRDEFEDVLQKHEIIRQVNPIIININGYIEAIHSTRPLLSKALGRNRSYIQNAIGSNSEKVLKNIVDLIIEKEKGKLSTKDFDLPSKEFKKKLQGLGY
jgi:hypothetical protein